MACQKGEAPPIPDFPLFVKVCGRLVSNKASRSRPLLTRTHKRMTSVCSLSKEVFRFYQSLLSTDTEGISEVKQIFHLCAQQHFVWRTAEDTPTGTGGWGGCWKEIKKTSTSLFAHSLRRAKMCKWRGEHPRCVNTLRSAAVMYSNNCDVSWGGTR